MARRLGFAPSIDLILSDGRRRAMGFWLSMAVRKGAAKPDMCSPEALKRALLDAKSIAHGNPAQSARAGHFAKVLDRLGIANEMKAKTVVTRTPGEVGVFVATGEDAIGVNQIRGSARTRGGEIAGPLPAVLQNAVVFSAAIVSARFETAEFCSSRSHYD